MPIQFDYFPCYQVPSSIVFTIAVDISVNIAILHTFADLTSIILVHCELNRNKDMLQSIPHRKEIEITYSHIYLKISKSTVR